MGERILVVEDEATLCANIARALGRAGHTVTAVERGRDAISHLDRISFDLVITDLRLPDISGLDVLDHVRQTSPESVILIMTAYASVESAVEALRRGAHDYVLKPLSLTEVQKKVDYIAESRRLGRENLRLRTLLRGAGDEQRSALTLIRSGARSMSALADMIEKVARSSSNLLIRGESGTGKELVAHAIHECSDRAAGPFVALDVSSMPDDLAESYLFGHQRGAFREATRSREGLFRTASGGSLFLDEVGDLSMATQAKLMRAVETKEILPVGEDVPLKVDTRIIAATHRDLGALVAEGRFRQDLLFRLHVIELTVPPLRDRPEDIPALVAHFVDLQAKKQRKTIHEVSPEALALLRAYRWPGNVRELGNVIERAIILASGNVITPVDLPAGLSFEANTTTSTPPPPLAATAKPSDPTPCTAPLTSDDACNLEQATLAFHRQHIARVLDRAGGNRDVAAKLLGLSSATFYRYLQRVGLRGYRASSE